MNETKPKRRYINKKFHIIWMLDRIGWDGYLRVVWDIEHFLGLINSMMMRLLRLFTGIDFAKIIERKFCWRFIGPASSPKASCLVARQVLGKNLSGLTKPYTTYSQQSQTGLLFQTCWAGKGKEIWTETNFAFIFFPTRRPYSPCWVIRSLINSPGLLANALSIS